MIRRGHVEQAQGAVSPTPEKAIIAQTEDGSVHTFYPLAEVDDSIAGHLTTLDPSTGERTFQQVSLPRSRLMESKDFIVNHKRGEIAAAVSLGAIVTGTLVVRHLRKHK